MINQSGKDKLSCWFGLSRASWITIPRVLAQEMSDEWQAKMADLLNEFDDSIRNQPEIETGVCIKSKGKFTSAFNWLHNYRHPDRNKIQSLKG